MKLADSVQANIIKPHGRNHAILIFIRFKTPKDDATATKKIRHWITELARRRLSSHRHQYVDTLLHKRNNSYQRTIYSLALSAAGYSKLMLPPVYTPTDEAFLQGMTATNRRRKLHDYDDSPIEDLYRMGNKHHIKIDAILSIAHDDENYLRQKAAYMRQEHAYQAAVYQDFSEYGFRYFQSNPARSAIGPLKFTDGHSNLRSTRKKWLATAVREKSPIASYPTFGSYLAFRKIRVNLGHFQKMVDNLYHDIQAQRPLKVIDKEYVAALFMGRFRDGTPLALYDCPSPKFFARLNKDKDLPFDYKIDRQGLLCPVHAHVRAVNPRTRGPHPSPILRRSLNFSDSGLNTTPNGLLFMSYQASITEQFEPLFDLMKDNEDAIAYRPPSEDRDRPHKSFPLHYGSKEMSNLHPIGGNELSTFLGGEYFFVPSITFLQKLHSLPLV